MQVWRLVRSVLLAAVLVFCRASQGQASDANGQTEAPPATRYHEVWQLDLTNRTVPQIPTPLVELIVNRGKIYGNLPDAEFWSVLNTSGLHRVKDASSLALNKTDPWALTLHDPVPNKKWPVWKEDLNEPIPGDGCFD